jgi:hypothetical protein
LAERARGNAPSPSLNPSPGRAPPCQGGRFRGAGRGPGAWRPRLSSVVPPGLEDRRRYSSSSLLEAACVFKSSLLSPNYYCRPVRPLRTGWRALEGAPDVSPGPRGHWPSAPGETPRPHLSTQAPEGRRPARAGGSGGRAVVRGLGAPGYRPSSLRDWRIGDWTRTRTRTQNKPARLRQPGDAPGRSGGWG